MKTGAGGCRDARRNGGYTLLGFVVVAFGLTVVSIVVATNFLGRFVDQTHRREERTLGSIRRVFLTSVARTQTIPTYTNWLADLTPFASLNQSGLTQAFPTWGLDPTLNRAFLVDTNLSPALLPYRQPATGLTGTATNLIGTAARVLILSSTKRGLALPVSSGVIASNSFNAIWNWRYDPSTKAPPSGWTSWTGFADHLHVERINLATLFHPITFNQLKYGVAGAASVTNLITNSVTAYFLYGTSLLLADTNGTIKRTHVVTRSASFSFASATNAGPILYYAFNATSGSIATNSGSTGSSANGIYTNGVTLGVAGPRSPAYTNYSASNTGISLDGVNDYVKGTNGLLNHTAGFTIAGWINPSTATLKNIDLFGQEDIGSIGFDNLNGRLAFWCDADTKKLTYSYPYGAGEWHHITAVKEPAAMYLYVDAVLVATRSDPTSALGSNANGFNVGGNVFGSGQYFPGTIDEVIVYNRALSASEVAQLYANQRP